MSEYISKEAIFDTEVSENGMTLRDIYEEAPSTNFDEGWDRCFEDIKDHIYSLPTTTEAEICRKFAERLKLKIKNNDYILTDRINSVGHGMFTDGIYQAIDEVLAEMERE